MTSLKAAEKGAADVMYETDSLQACLQQFQRGQDKMSDNITCLQDANDRFSADLKEDRKYMDWYADEKDGKKLDQFRTWIAERFVKAH